tara:strand:+ start:254 stop:844 length:591 start_codon:yes stop_codon:yes gene_type:complete
MSTIRVSGDSSGYYDLTVPSTAGSNSIDLSKLPVKDASNNLTLNGDLTIDGTATNNNPAWSVYNTTQTWISTPHQSTELLVWDGEDFDIGGNFANNKFTCPVAGIYWAEVHLHHADTCGSISLTLWRERSGSSTRVSYHNRSGTNIIERGIRTSQLIQCQAGDLIWAGLWHANNHSNIYLSYDGSTYSGFQGYLVG